MKNCVICRKPKDDFNDEHVIPDAIQGYYHIYKVCTECNSFMGANVDNKITNHAFIQFQRYLLDIKGKGGSVPNPLSGYFSLKGDPAQPLAKARF